MTDEHQRKAAEHLSMMRTGDSAKVERLTAELAEMTANYTAALSLIDRMQADVEWSRRAGEVT